MLTAGATVATVDRRFLRPGWIFGHLLVVVAFLVCCRLGLWQWHRTKDADGTLQNLSYAILWPAFGIAFIYMWIKFLRLETAKDAAESQELDDGLAAILSDGAADDENLGADAAPVGDGSAGAAAGGVRAGDARETDSGDADAETDGANVDDDAEGEADEDSYDEGTFVGTVEVVDDDDDPELAAYNRALAALAERDERRGR
ncbi:hypothetical protein [Nakamurella lactea]|uniref:hypothetical protein n=1 Tax=Nakamurella lactea TaxID=459515 RepID=UPI000418D278|nr:hypothetical protein [Nakamurella lactea]